LYKNKVRMMRCLRFIRQVKVIKINVKGCTEFFTVIHMECASR
jgi:hypothetical protein